MSASTTKGTFLEACGYLPWFKEEVAGVLSFEYQTVQEKL